MFSNCAPSSAVKLLISVTDAAEIEPECIPAPNPLTPAAVSVNAFAPSATFNIPKTSDLDKAFTTPSEAAVLPTIVSVPVLVVNEPPPDKPLPAVTVIVEF